MLFLAGSRDRFTSFVPPSLHWVRGASGLLSDDDRRLWRAVGTGAEPWAARVSAARGADVWSRVVLVDDAPRSQFDSLQELLREGPSVAAPVACLALTGRSFHGHRGRSWEAVSGNLHLSLALTPRLPLTHLLPALTMLPAVAVVSAVAEATSGVVRPGIKWVNDILLAGRKIGGVLTASQTRGDILESVVLGIGLNVARSPTVPPTPFVPSVGCVADAPAGNARPDLPSLFWGVLEAVGGLFLQLVSGGPAALFRAYCEASLVIGRRVRIWSETSGERDLDGSWPQPLARGVVDGIEPDLSLVIRGRPQPVSKGRLAYEEECRSLGL